MSKGMTETKFLIYTFLGIFLLLAVRLYEAPLTEIYNPINYVAIHMILEVICIAISAAVFLYGVKNFTVTRSSRMLLLSFTFLIVGLTDLLHTLSFKGMPFFITESSVQKATWFWIAARGLQAVLMLCLLLLPDRKIKRGIGTISLLVGFFLTIMLSSFIILQESNLPLLVVEGEGTTLIKNGIEYVISLFLFISLVVCLYQYYLKKEEATLYFGLAMVFSLLTELIFTIYTSVFDLDNFLGHIYKVFGFCLILKACYFAKDQREADSIEKHPFSSHPGMFFQLKKKASQFICVKVDGQLLEKIGYHQEEIIGRPLSEVFPIIDDHFDDYCRLSEKLQDSVTFGIPYLDKSLLFTICPSVDENDQDVILGNVLDTTKVHFEMNNDENSVHVVM